MKKSIDIDTLLEFEENNPELLDFRFNFDDILIWPHFLRHQIFNQIIYNFSYDAYSLNKFKNDSTPVKISKKYENVTNSLSLFNIDKDLAKFDIIIMTSARWKEEIGKNFLNPLSDYFALEFIEKTLIIEDSYRYEYSYPKYYESINYMARDSIDLLVSEKVSGSSIHPKDIKSIENIIQFLKKNLPFKISESMYNNLKKILCSISVKLQFYYSYYYLLINKVSPKLFFLHGASYTSKGYLVKWLKNWNVTVGEFMHGNVDRFHPAYNYPDSTFHNNEFIQYLPDYLLTFGQFTNDNIRHPAQKIAIGCPHIANKVKSASIGNKTKRSKQNILIISKPNMTKEFADLTRSLSELFNNSEYELVHRLHPIERFTFCENYQEICHLENVKISNSGDIYDLLCDADHVVGCYSNVLYEALAFNKSIYIYKISDIISIDIGLNFNNAFELCELIQNNAIKNITNANYYWEMNWQENYHKFIRSILSS